MSLITGFKLTVEEYASQAEWIEKLLRPLNNFAQSTVNVVNGNLTLGQNVVATYKTVRAQVPGLPWQELFPESGWVNDVDAPIGYYVDADGCINFRGSIFDGDKLDGTIIFTLPDEILYPVIDMHFSIPHDDKKSAHAILSSTDGTMKIYDLSGGATALYLTDMFYYLDTPPAVPAFEGRDWPIKLSTDFSTTVAGVLLTQAIDIETNEKASAATAGIDWLLTARNEVTVKRVNGLTPKRTYDLTFLIVGA